jgi:hypothetical protein
LDERVATGSQTHEAAESSATGSDAPPARPPRRYRRKLLFTLWIVAGLLGVLYVFGPIVAAPFIQDHLQRMVSDHLWAELSIGKLSYTFPFGVRAYDVALVARDHRGGKIDLVRAKELELSLAEIPWRDRPLIIKRVVIREPSIHLVMNEDGLVGARHLIKTAEERAVEEGLPLPPPPPTKEKPSDYFRLRRFEVHDAKVMFQDRRGGEELPWVVWEKLGAHLDIEPASSGSQYKYALSTDDAPLVKGNVRGHFDIDAAVIDVERFAMELRVERGKAQPQLPPRLQQVLRDYEVEGGLTLSGKAHVAVRDPDANAYEATLDLPKATARISDHPGAPDWLSLKVRFSSQAPEEARQEVRRPVTLTELPVMTQQATSRPSAPPKNPPSSGPSKKMPTLVSIDRLEVGTGDTVLHVDKGEATIDPITEQWRVKDLLGRLEIGQDRSGLPTKVERALEKFEITGKMRMTATAAGPLRPVTGKRLMDQVDYQVIAYPREMAIRPPKWARPFTNVSGTVRANQEAITFENVEGQYLGDRYFLNTARIPMDGIERVVRVDEVVGTIQPTGRNEDYPKPFEFVARELRPSGTWFVTGWFARRRGLPPGEKPDFRFDIRADDAAGDVSKKHFPLTGVRAQIVATPQLVDIKRIDALSLGGRAIAEGYVVPGKGAAMRYDLHGWVRDVDMKALGTLVSKEHKQPKRLSGKGSANVHVWGTGKDLAGRFTAADTVKADGRFEIVDGDFYDLAAVQEISKGVKANDNEATTVGHAAGEFTLHDRIVEFPHVALSAPVLGVQGSGRATFDGQLDFDVVAAPLADWKDQMKRTNIPIVSDVAGAVLGGVQKLINTATKTLLYEFHVTGRVGEPRVTAVPVPVLTEGVAKLFGSMARGERIGEPLEGVEGRK